MPIHKTAEGFVISECSCWRPGVYESQEAASLALKGLDDEALQRLQERANERSGGLGGIITMADLRADQEQ